MNPIFPFEPVRTDKFPVEENWIAQVKWDGVLMRCCWGLMIPREDFGILDMLGAVD